MAKMHRSGRDLMIERSMDYRRIKRLSDWDLVISQEVYYLIEAVNGKDAGVWAFIPCNGGFQVHVNMGAGCRGSTAASSARDAFAWLFDNTGCQMIFADIPSHLRHVHIMASHIGMTFDEVDCELRCFTMMRQDFAELRKAA